LVKVLRVSKMLDQRSFHVLERRHFVDGSDAKVLAGKPMGLCAADTVSRVTLRRADE
jgi:hypothetical protein